MYTEVIHYVCVLRIYAIEGIDALLGSSGPTGAVCLPYTPPPATFMQAQGAEESLDGYLLAQEVRTK